MVEKDKTRAFVVMVIEWILFLLTFIAVIILAVAVGRAVSDLDDADKNNNGDTRSSSSIQDTAKDFLKIILIIIIVYLFISLLLNTLLTVGILKEHTTCCKIWYIVGIIGIVFQGLSVVAALVTLNFVAIIVNLIVIGYKVFAVKTIMDFTAAVVHENENGRNNQLYAPVHN